MWQAVCWVAVSRMGALLPPGRYQASERREFCERLVAMASLVWVVNKEVPGKGH